MRAVMTIWSAAAAGLAWLAWLAGNLRLWEAVAITGTLGFACWAFWTVVTDRGAHADRAGLAVTSPAAGPAGSMVLDEELDWLARTGSIPPLRYDTDGGVSGAMCGDKQECWPFHDGDLYGLPKSAAAATAPVVPPREAAAAQDSTGPGPSSSSPPGPVEPSMSGVERFIAEQDADVALFLERMREAW